MLLLLLLMRSSPDFLRRAEEAQPLESLAEGFPEALTPEFVATPPQWLIVVANLVLALLIAALVVGAVWLLWRLQRQRVSPLRRRLLPFDKLRTGVARNVPTQKLPLTPALSPTGRGSESPLPRRERVRVRGSFCPLRMAHRAMEDSQ